MWVNKKPECGDHIRVNRGYYYHHGIYENDDVIYQFASPKGSEISPDTAIICITDLNSFLKGSDIEVRIYNDAEKMDKRSPKDIIKAAKSKLNDNFGGYNLINNNCEHFANWCVFGVKKSDQVDDILSKLGGLFK